MMVTREVTRIAIDGGEPPYAPCHCTFAVEAQKKLRGHFGTADLDTAIENHMFGLGSSIGFFEDIGHDCWRDVSGVI